MLKNTYLYFFNKKPTPIYKYKRRYTYSIYKYLQGDDSCTKYAYDATSLGEECIIFHFFKCRVASMNNIFCVWQLQGGKAYKVGCTYA